MSPRFKSLSWRPSPTIKITLPRNADPQDESRPVKGRFLAKPCSASSVQGKQSLRTAVAPKVSCRPTGS